MNRISDQRGFTVIELVVAIAIISTLATMLSTTMSQYVRSVSLNRAMFEANHAFMVSSIWMGKDFQMGEAIDLEDDTSDTSFTMTWVDEYDGASDPHSVTYALVGSELLRTYDGNQITVARNISSLTFSRCKGRVSMDMTVSPGNGSQAARYIYSYRIELIDTTPCDTGAPVVGAQTT